MFLARQRNDGWSGVDDLLGASHGDRIGAPDVEEGPGVRLGGNADVAALGVEDQQPALRHHPAHPLQDPQPLRSVLLKEG